MPVGEEITLVDHVNRILLYAGYWRKPRRVQRDDLLDVVRTTRGITDDSHSTPRPTHEVDLECTVAAKRTDEFHDRVDLVPIRREAAEWMRIVGRARRSQRFRNQVLRLVSAEVLQGSSMTEGLDELP